jgi:hypothetical protein
MSTSFSNPDTIVIQFNPDENAGIMQINGNGEYRTSANVFIPDPNTPINTIGCSLNYFQDSVSIPEGWILNDNQQRININNGTSFNRVVITKKSNGIEEEIVLPVEYSEKLLDYFNLDIPHNENDFVGFDCSAFVSSIANVNYNPENPEFSYHNNNPDIGEIVVLSDGGELPNSIKHWAIYLGNNQYLSKFGRTGEGAQSHISVMNLERMMNLYNCTESYVATPIENANPWVGYTA